MKINNPNKIRELKEKQLRWIKELEEKIIINKPKFDWEEGQFEFYFQRYYINESK